MKNSIIITEPVRWEKLMIALNNWMTKHDLLVWLVPYTADIFVFTYPVYLVALYLYGINKRSTYYKEAALAVFFSAAMASITNQVIQFFGEKSRPEQAITNKENLLLSHLPTDPFPSDHAAVSMAIAMATLMWGLRHKDKKFLRWSVFFFLASLTMGVSRVTLAIHWPTDILVWISVWVLSALLIFSRPVWKRLKKWLIAPLIHIEKWLFKKVFWVDQS